MKRIQLLINKTKKGRGVFWVVAYFFLTIMNVATAIAMIMAIVEAAKYMSFDGRVVTGIGDGVGAAAETANDVSACDG